MTRNSYRSLALVCAITLAACGNESSSSNSSEGAVDTTAPAGDDTTTTAATQDTTVTTDPAAPATDAPSDDAEARAQRKVQAALDSLPADWMGTIASDLGEEGESGDDIVFNPCLGPDDYNLDNLDIDSAASWELDAQMPTPGSPFIGPQATVEARVFLDEARAEAAYAVLEKMIGTDAGRECLASEVPGQMAADAPDGSTFDARVEGTTIEGVDVGARIIVTFNSEGLVGEFYVDLVASKADPTCTIFATFISFAAPVDQVVASQMFVAALTAS